jgi:leucyl aminopeptidase
VPRFEVSSARPAEVEVDLLVLPFHKGRAPGPGVEEVERAMGVDLGRLLAEHRVEGKVGDTFLLPTLGRVRAGNLLLVGLGPREEAGPAEVRKAAMKAARSATRFASMATTLAQVGPPREAAHALAEGVVLGTYRFLRYKARPLDEQGSEESRLRRVVALAGAAPPAELRAGLRRGEVYAEAANWARDLVNTPAIDATPAFLADEARAMARRAGLECRVWARARLARGGFGGILGVGAGSANEPRLVELAYRGGGDAPAIALTGKGVTFDSGGLSLKDAAGMEHMKMDMAGAAAVFACMRAVAELDLPVNVVAAVPAVENMPGGSAIRPGDVLRHRGGKTSEVVNTDAEGRLILADALAYLAERKPALLVDVATLTGAAMVALGTDISAVIGSDRELVEAILRAAREEGEPAWELPLWTEYRRHLESAVADVKNVGPRWGGAINAALFLKEFVGDLPWAHLDIAGTAFSEGNDLWPKGATGAPARTLVRLIESRADRTGRRPRASSRPPGSRRGSR